MATQNQHRLLIVAPNARKAAFLTWWVANIDPNGGDCLDAGLSATGNLPATFWWLGGQFTNAEVRKILTRLCNLASLTPPGALASYTKAQFIAWFQGNRAAVIAATGIRVLRDDGDGVWTDPDTELAGAGLQRIKPVMI